MKVAGRMVNRSLDGICVGVCFLSPILASLKRKALAASPGWS